MPRHDTLSGFDDIFASDILLATPELTNVAPGLTSGTGARFEQKALNPRRTAVSGRAFRSPSIRSTLQDQTPLAVPGGTPQSALTSPSTPGAARISTGRGDADVGAAGGGFVDPSSFTQANVGGDVSTSSPALSSTIGTGIATDLGKSGAQAAIGAAGTGLASGFSPAAIASGLPGAFVSTALGPLAVANTVGGGLASGQLGFNAATDLGQAGIFGEDVTTGQVASPANISNAAIAGFQANPATLTGLASKQAMATAGFGLSPSQAALSASFASLAEQGAFAESAMTTESGLVSNAPGSAVGRDALAAAANTQSSLSALTSDVGGQGFSPDFGGLTEGQGMVTPGGFSANIPGMGFSESVTSNAASLGSSTSPLGFSPSGKDDPNAVFIEAAFKSGYGSPQGQNPSTISGRNPSLTPDLEGDPGGLDLGGDPGVGGFGPSGGTDSGGAGGGGGDK
jgi:hypothetical protein